MADNMYNPWEEKLYETLAKQVLVIVNQHREEATKIGQAVQELNTNPRYSDFGKNELVQKLREELKALNESKTKELKALAKQFVKEYQVVRADDGKANSMDVANALKIIDMCGNSITVEVLRTALEPIKGSYTTLKMIRSIFEARQVNVIAVQAAYPPDCIELLDEYLGANCTVFNYEDAFATVREVLDMPELFSAGIVGIPNYSGTVINNLVDNTPYYTLCLSDNMMKVGKLYDSVSLEYPRLFK